LSRGWRLSSENGRSIRAGSGGYAVENDVEIVKRIWPVGNKFDKFVYF